MTPADKTAIAKSLAREAGFDRVGICQAKPIGHADYLRQWLRTGRAGSMQYLHRNTPIRQDPRNLLHGAKSVIVCALNYHQPTPDPPKDGRPYGNVAMYAWGRDYHLVVKRRLHNLADRMHQEIAESFQTRCCVDTVPILERELAAMAGVGWIGKNTLVLHQDLGSCFFLGEIVTTLELTPDQTVTDHCGTCTRCLDACPTDAFPAPYEMDASKCISYLTIEHRSQIPKSLADKMGNWIFGCDICQQVCPYNQDAPTTDAFPIQPPGPSVACDDVMAWDGPEYKKQTNDSAASRATHPMWQRNALIVRSNSNKRRSPN